jgi:hypothetical protein
MVKARKNKTVEPVRKTVFATTLIFHLFRIPVTPEKVPARNPFFEKPTLGHEFVAFATNGLDTFGALRIV